MRFAELAQANVRPDVILLGDGLTEHEAGLAKLDAQVNYTPTPTSTECPEEELLDLGSFEEDEAEEAEEAEEGEEGEGEEEEEADRQGTAPVISSASFLRRQRLQEERRQLVHEFLAKQGFQEVNTPKSVCTASFFSKEAIYPIHRAAQLGHHRMVRELLRLGADPEVRTSRGRTAYDLAAQENKFNSHGMVLDLLSGKWNVMSLRDLMV
ncbi:MRL1 [Symbiodinium natans]|uniref:MRL1 protein n=1 Tax=Symbiodinium natans TaxID=878477 RepID=A0A812NVI7_9DINO|nr:MRL1 [Symbiodinium natans]